MGDVCAQFIDLNQGRMRGNVEFIIAGDHFDDLAALVTEVEELFPCLQVPGPHLAILMTG